MKTTKIIISITLVALTVISFGQMSSVKERLFSKHNADVVYYTADYQAENSRIENWMFDLRSWASNKITREANEAPALYRTINVDQADVVFEEELALESWMTAPFERGIVEEALTIESWMTTPWI
ncbi:MAG: hypothetical protein KAT15_08935 [Bacteroidales bacterium]|nr:hypothetical protein [Bacteroidales bacterium]